MKINLDESKYIVFKKKQKVDPMDEIEVTGSRIKRVEQINYVGKVSTDNSSIAGDVDRCCDSFLRQLNGMYHKIKFLDMNVLHFLFISYCMSLLNRNVVR